MHELYFTAVEVAKMIGVSRGKAYSIISELNDELRKQNCIVVAGKIPKTYFAEKYYGGLEGNLSVSFREVSDSQV